MLLLSVPLLLIYNMCPQLILHMNRISTFPKHRTNNINLRTVLLFLLVCVAYLAIISYLAIKVTLTFLA